jgi:hypothetical protein
VLDSFARIHTGVHRSSKFVIPTMYPAAKNAKDSRET